VPEHAPYDRIEVTWLAGAARPLYVRHLSIEALPSTVVPPRAGLVVRRRNFQFVIREEDPT
jgi:hypothetical protein